MLRRITKLHPVLLGVLVGAACGLNFAPGDSDKVGQITSVHRQGMFCKTWEMQIVRGGLQGGSGTIGGAYNLTIENDSLAALAQQYMEAGTEVKVHYRSEGLYAMCRSDSGGEFVTTIAPVVHRAG